MKKLIVVCTILIVSGLSCKKICACDPDFADLYLVIRGAAGDLLNPATNGYYAKDQIELYFERASGVKGPVKFNIDLPIPKGNALALDYYQLHVGEEVSAFTTSEHKLFLKLGNGLPKRLQIKRSDNVRYFSELLIDDKILPAEKKHRLRTLFYFTL